MLFDRLFAHAASSVASGSLAAAPLQGSYVASGSASSTLHSGFGPSSSALRSSASLPSFMVSTLPSVARLATAARPLPRFRHASLVPINGIAPLLGSMHSLAHTPGCRVLWSLDLQPDAPCTTGESGEHPWVRVGKAASYLRFASVRHYLSGLSENVYFHNLLRQTRLMPEALQKSQSALPAARRHAAAAATILQGIRERTGLPADRILSSLRQACDDIRMSYAGIEDVSAPEMVKKTKALAEYYTLSQNVECFNAAIALCRASGLTDAATAALFQYHAPASIKSLQKLQQTRLATDREQAARRLRELRESKLLRDIPETALGGDARKAAAERTFKAVHELISLAVDHRRRILEKNARADDPAVRQPLRTQLANTSRRIRELMSTLKALSPLCSINYQRCALMLPADPKDLKGVGDIPPLHDVDTEFVTSRQYLALAEAVCAIGQYEQDIIWHHNEMVNLLETCKLRYHNICTVMQLLNRGVPASGPVDPFARHNIFTAAALSVQSVGAVQRNCSAHHIAVLALSLNRTRQEAQEAASTIRSIAAEHARFQSWLKAGEGKLWWTALQYLRGIPPSSSLAPLRDGAAPPGAATLATRAASAGFASSPVACVGATADPATTSIPVPACTSGTVSIGTQAAGINTGSS